MVLYPRAAIVPTAPSLAGAAHVIEEENATWYFLVAILTLLVYDALTTMDKEVKHFWALSLNPVAIVYFANRYIGLLGAVSNLFIETYKATLPLCNFAIWSRSLSYWATIVLIDYILMMRVLALYSRGRIMSICLNSLLILSALLKLGILIYITLVQDIAVYEIARDVRICGERKDAALAWGVVDWLIPVAYGVVLLILALYKALRYCRMNAGFSGSHLIKILIHDQIFYFFLVVVCCILNMLQFKIHVTNTIVSGIVSTLGCPSLLCIAGSRMLFNLKEAGSQVIEERRTVTYGTKSSGTTESISLHKLSA